MRPDPENATGHPSSPPPASGSWRRFEIASFVAGAAFLGWMLARVGPARLAGELARVGWGFLIVLLLQSAPILLNTLSWGVLLPAGRRVPLSALAPMLLAGEALNTVSPVGFIGGEVVRVSLLRRRMPTAEAAGSVGLAAGTQFAGQILFLLSGFPFAFALVHSGRLRTGIAIAAIAIAVLLTVLLAAAVSPACLALGRRVIGRVGFLAALHRRIPPQARRTINGALETLRSHPGAFALSIAASLSAWQMGAVETFLILRLLGHPIGLITALAIEALAVAVEGVLFFVPARMGTQEGGRALVFLALGLDPAVGLALGLVRRTRELAWAVPGLVILGFFRREPGGLPTHRGTSALTPGERPLPD